MTRQFDRPSSPSNGTRSSSFSDDEWNPFPDLGFEPLARPAVQNAQPKTGQESRIESSTQGLSAAISAPESAPLLFPYNDVVLIEAQDPNDPGEFASGSGVVIGPHTILTASHIVFNPSDQTGATQLTLYPGYNSSGIPNPGSGNPISTSWTDHFYQIGTYGSINLSQSDSQYDFAIIDTSYTFSSWMGVLVNYSGGSVHITGYPASANGAQTDTIATVSADPNYRILDYPSGTVSPGNSGGPLWLNYNGSDDVAGLVSTGGWGVQLTSADWSTIQGWVASDGYSIGNSTSTGSGVDLTITLNSVNTDLGFGGSSTTTSPGGSVAITYTVNNSGSQPIGAGDIAFYLSTDPTITTSDTFIVYADLFNAVPANGNTGQITSTVALPSNLAPGTYYVGAIVNYNHNIAESNYANNASAGDQIIVTSGNVPGSSFTNAIDLGTFGTVNPTTHLYPSYYSGTKALPGFPVYYKITLNSAEGENDLQSFLPYGFDAVYRLYNSTGGEVTPGSYTSLFSNLANGTYYLEVGGGSNNSITYSFGIVGYPDFINYLGTFFHSSLATALNLGTLAPGGSLSWSDSNYTGYQRTAPTTSSPAGSLSPDYTSTYSTNQRGFYSFTLGSAGSVTITEGGTHGNFILYEPAQTSGGSPFTQAVTSGQALALAAGTYQLEVVDSNTTATAQGDTTVESRNSHLEDYENFNFTITLSTAKAHVGSAKIADYSSLATPGLVAIIQGGGGSVQKGGGNGTDTVTGIQSLVDMGTGRSNGDVFEVDTGVNITANSSNFNYLIELSANATVSYGTNFAGITEFVSNTGTNTINFSSDPNFAYLYGSTGNDTLTLGSGGGYMFGEGGANILNGGANATNLFVGGQGGTDTMNGGTGTASNFYFVDGNDQVNGAGAFNTMIELIPGVTIQLGSARYQHIQEFVAGGGNNIVTVAGTDTDFTYLYGGAGNDTLTTGSGGGYLFGEGGTNVLTGGGGVNVFVADGASGIDTMNGGSSSNIYYIDANSAVHGAGSFNTVVELQQNVTLTLGSAQLGSNVQEAVLNAGTNTADFHTATAAVYLYGAAGNDTLFGGTGSDFLYGGAGTNTFKFGVGWGHDTIKDWTTGTGDQIDLTSLSGLGVHAVADLTQTISGGNDVITSSHTGTNSITLSGVGSALGASSFHFN